MVRRGSDPKPQMKALQTLVRPVKTDRTLASAQSFRDGWYGGLFQWPCGWLSLKQSCALPPQRESIPAALCLGEKANQAFFTLAFSERNAPYCSDNAVALPCGR